MYSDATNKVCSEEEIELRDLIMQNLENSGFLKKVKAELRAGVFLALEEDGNLKNKFNPSNKNFDDFISTSEGKLVISLIREFLEFFNLNFTLSVFDPEIAVSTPYMSRSELCDQVKFKASEITGPVISALLNEAIEIRNQKLTNKSNNSNSPPEKSIKLTLTNNETEKNILDNLLNQVSSENEEKFTPSNLKKDDSAVKNSEADLKDNLSTPVSATKTDMENNKKKDGDILNILKERSDEVEKDNSSSIFKNPSNELIVDHDPFFDEPVPPEKSSFFAFSDALKDKSDSKLPSSNKKGIDDSKKSSLSSLKDLPSLTTSHEWSFNRDLKNTLPSLDSLKSVSSSEASNEEIINLDPKGIFEKDSDVAESNEESSEKQISEESIEEEIDEDSSVNFDELLNNSLSLGEDQTTDQTVSQVSVVEGTDHIEST